jgi:anti-repressor protein
LQRNNVPYQRFIGGGYFQVKESVGYNHINYTTYVTGKGQTWLHKKLKELAFI